MRECDLVTMAPRVVKELAFKILKEDWFVYKLKAALSLKSNLF
jgi:hypothetical protein